MNANFKQRRQRIGALGALLGGLFLLAALRLTLLVLIDGPRLASMARSEHTSELALAAVRGPIVDRNGRPLALSVETRSVYARPRRLLESTNATERARLAETLGLAPAALEARLSRKSPFIWLARHLKPQLARGLDELGFEGVGTATEYQRFYPERDLAQAVVGMAGVDGQGLSGIELKYDRLARGAPVEMSFYHDALGHPILDSPVALDGPVAGARLEVTIDSTIQAQAEGYLAAQVAASGARHGTAIVLDPFTGEVLALANADPTSASDAARLHDAGVQDAFEPGSTIKGILGAIALNQQVIDTRRQIYCERGEWQFAGHKIHDDSPHDWLDLGGIVAVSSNIGAAKVALAMGAERYYRGLAAFGFGRKTGIDLPGEASGLLRPAATWRPIDLANHGFGQGLAVTPIQLATAYAAIANGGMVMRPYVLKAAYDAAGHQLIEHTPQALGRALAPAVAHQMNLLLRGVVNAPDGTGRLAQVADFTVAGKTGTAQMVNPATGTYYQSRLVSSFVGFVPAQDPRLVILVVLYDVQHGHFGGLYAAPVFSEIAASALRHLSVAPDSGSHTIASLIPLVPAALAGAISDEADQADGAPASRRFSSTGPSTGADENSLPGLTPDFHGLSLRSAFALARARRLNLESAGAGYVMKQNPRAGAPIDGRPVQLVLASNAMPGASELISLTGRTVIRHAKAATRRFKARGSVR
jgi:cell division protein FtsI (penicillin-binding protein 3)